MKNILKITLALSILLCLGSCHKVREGSCWIEMTEANGHIYPVYYSVITKSTGKKITFSGEDINGTLNKKGKSVDGVLTLGNDLTFQYTFTVNVTGTISGKMNIDGNYTSDTRSGTFKVKL